MCLRHSYELLLCRGDARPCVDQTVAVCAVRVFRSPRQLLFSIRSTQLRKRIALWKPTEKFVFVTRLTIVLTAFSVCFGVCRPMLVSACIFKIELQCAILWPSKSYVIML